MNYPQTTGHVAESITSRESAEIMDASGQANNQAQFILNALTSAGANGCTADQLTVMMRQNGYPHIHNGTVAGRIVHLEKKGDVRKTALTRKTSANRNACVYIASQHARLLDDSELDISGIQKSRAKIKSGTIDRDALKQVMIDFYHNHDGSFIGLDEAVNKVVELVK